MGAPLGNINAIKNKPFAEALSRAIAQDDGKRLRAIAEQLLNKAADGDLAAIREFIDRTDGKAVQGVILSGDEDKPLISRIELVPMGNASTG